jgi:hypothetical protein
LTMSENADKKYQRTSDEQLTAIEGPYEGAGRQMIGSIKKNLTERSEVFLHRVKSDPEGYVSRYLEAHTENGIVKISADRARSLFPEYGSSKEGAFENTESTNAAASKIAGAAFDKAVASGDLKGKQVDFITGMPGAGKSTAENAPHDNRGQLALVYEGNLSDPQLLQRRVQEVIDAGAEPTLYYVKAPAKTALDRMVDRQGKIGRYVPIQYGAQVAANTPKSIEALHKQFGGQVQYRTIDNSGKPEDAKVGKGFDAIRKMAENRTTDEIRDEQHAHAKELLASGKLSPEVYERIKPRGESRPAQLGDAGEHKKTSTGSLIPLL